MTEAMTWNTLARQLTDDESVLAAARQFTEDPSGYFADHEDDLFQRGIDDPEDVTGVIVLIDALEKIDEVAYLDWKSPVDEVTGLLARLSRIKDTGTDLSVLIGPGYAAEADVETVVRWVNGLLAPKKVTVAILDEDSDAYPLIAVPTETVDTVVGTAAHLDAEVRVLRASFTEVTEMLADSEAAGTPR